MSIYGEPLGITNPVVGTDTFAAAATNLNTIIDAIRTVLEQKVRPSGIDINADLSFLSGGTFFKAKDLKAVQFEPGANQTAGSTPAAIFFKSADGELYVNDDNGNQIQITDSGALNIAISGGITGAGYGSGGVVLNWDSGSSTFQFRDGVGADDWAHIKADNLILQDGSGNTITVGAPSIASDITLLLPPTLPAANESILKVDSTGAITAAETFTPEGGVFALTGAQTVTGNLTAAGLRYTAEDTFVIPASAAGIDAANVVFVGNGGLTVTSNGFVEYPIRAPVGSRIKSWSASGKITVGSGTFTATLKKRSVVSDVVVAIETDTSGSTVGTYYTPGTTLVSPEIVTDGFEYFIVVSQNSGTSQTFTGAKFAVDRPT